MLAFERLGALYRKGWAGVSKGPRVPVVCGIIVITVILMALFAPILAPYPPNEGELRDRLLPAFSQGRDGGAHFLGTDMLGRDILSRIIYGARVSLAVSSLAIVFAGSIGSTLGIAGAYFGGWRDVIISRITDMMLGLPAILIAFVLAVTIGPSFQNVIIVIALIFWARYTRIARGAVLSVKEKDFVVLARLAGCSNLRIVMRHILPNTINSLVVLATLQLGYVITVEASLSFLGVGVPPPTASWGSMVADGRALIGSAWWISVFPGLAIILTVLSFNLLGDWLRDTLDPKLSQV